MRLLLLLSLIICLAGVVQAAHSPFAAVLQPANKASSRGDGATVPRTGGENISSATVISALPFSDTGATCGYINDYDEVCPYSGSTSPDVVYAYTAGTDTGITVDLCSSSYDTKVYVYAGAEGDPVGCNDDASCGYSGWQSRLTLVQLAPGTTYYIVVDGYGTSCGTYVLNVTEFAPCALPCPPGALQEGEPPCVDGYVDTYNGGCMSGQSGWVDVPAQAYQCATICGRSCTYLFAGMSYRDTDWYRVAAAGGTLSYACVAQFPFDFALIYGTDCNNLQYLYAQSQDCIPGSLIWTCLAGQEVWLFVTPTAYNGVSELNYVLTVCGIEGEPPPPAACCDPSGSCSLTSESGCGWEWHPEWTSCDPNPCSEPDWGACCFPEGLCQMLSSWQCYSMLHASFLPGVPCEPNPCPALGGACCLPDGSCQGMTWADCVAASGSWHFDWPCNPNPCPQSVFGACCVMGGPCVYLSMSECEWNGGIFMPSVSCDPEPCLAACCYPDGTCQVMFPIYCNTGEPQEVGSTCDPNPCPGPVPTERTSWGKIKVRYR